MPEPLVNFQTTRHKICTSCKVSDSKLLSALKPIIDRYQTTHCFPKLSDIEAWCKLRKDRYQMGATYSKLTHLDGIGSTIDYSVKPLFLPAQVDICHFNPASNGGLMNSGNLFLWHSSENRAIKDKNSYLWKHKSLAPTLGTNNSLLSIHEELLKRFGDDYVTLKSNKGLIDEEYNKQTWRELTGCSTLAKAQEWLDANDYMTFSKPEVLTDQLLTRVQYQYPALYGASLHSFTAYINRNRERPRQLTLRELTFMLHHIPVVVDNPAFLAQ